ncbi:dynein regulation protein LC7 [candidate division KSB1 bacterium]|nr:dynein regulation protein LC7 [candidate division KSB1 bacterium]
MGDVKMAAKKTSTKLLNTLLDLEGVDAVTVVGRDGFVIENASNTDLDLDAVGAIVSTGFGASEVMAEEMNIGKITQTMVECDLGKIIMADCDEAILAVITDSAAVIGKIRHNILKLIDDLKKTI